MGTKKARILALLGLFVLLSNFSTALVTNPVPTPKASTRKLDLSILFHANQANVPYAVFGDETCYNPVLETLLNHPNSHFPLHFSGTLLTDLAWFNPDTLDLLNQGYQNGLFEIIGSTYAQNIIYSLEENYDNQNQIEKHLQTIDEILGANPTGFWNPERCWNQSQYLPLLTSNNYEYTFLEDHIIADATPVVGYDEFKVRQLINNSQELLIVNDDKEIINYIDTIGFISEPSTHPDVVNAVDALIAHLTDIYNNDIEDDYFVFYGQDMEAWGLWQTEGYLAPADSIENVMDRLDYLLTRLEAESDWLNLITPQEFIDNLPSEYTFEQLSYIPDGQATWMQSPSQNQGYSDWFDFNFNDSDLEEFRGVYTQTRNRLIAIKTAIEEETDVTKQLNAKRLMSYAEFVYAANQYEFGCIGVENNWFYRAKSALITAEAAFYALSPSLSSEIIVQDLDLDGRDEYIIRDVRNYFVFSKFGARLINWYDISQGSILTANDIPNTYLNQDGTNYRGTDPLSAPIDPIEPGDQWGRNDQRFILRPNSLYDSFEDKENQYFWQLVAFTPKIIGSTLEFSAELSSRNITKSFQLNSTTNELQIKYSYQNKELSSIRPLIGFTFTPDNEKMLFQGSQGIEIEIKTSSTEKRLIINNTFSKVGIQIYTNSLSGEFQNDSINPMFGVGVHLNLSSIPGTSNSTIEFSLKALITQEDFEDINDDGTNTEDSTGRISSFPLNIFPLFSFFAVSTIYLRFTKTRKKH